MSNIGKCLVSDKEKMLKNLIDPVSEIKLIEFQSSFEDKQIARALGRNNFTIEEENFGKKLELNKYDEAYGGAVYTMEQIKKLARQFNLRYLPVGYYVGNIDQKVISKVKEFAKATNTEITEENLKRNFYILAPESCFSLKEVHAIKTVMIDPGLFYQIDDNHARLVYNWGADFTIWNRIMGFKYSSRLNHGIFNVIIYALFFVTICYFLAPVTSAIYLTAIGFIAAFINPYWDEEITDTNKRYHDGKWNKAEKLVGTKVEYVRRFS